MKKSLKIFIAIIILYFLVDRSVYEIIHIMEENVTTGQSVGKINQFFEVKDSVDVVIFGSSRALHHVDPASFSKSAYNAGLDGTRIGAATALISSLNKSKQTLLIHIDHNRIFDSSYLGEDANALLYKSFEDKKTLNFFKKFNIKETIISKASNSYVYNGKLLGILRNYFLPNNEHNFKNGFEPIIPTNVQKEIFKKMYERKPKRLNVNVIKPLKINGLVDRYVDYILEVSKKNESRIIFFTSPSLNKVDEEVKEATRLFFKAKGIVYYDDIDYLDDYGLNIWKDHTHLALKGAELYTIKLQKNLRIIK